MHGLLYKAWAAGTAIKTKLLGTGDGGAALVVSAPGRSRAVTPIYRLYCLKQQGSASTCG